MIFSERNAEVTDSFVFPPSPIIAIPIAGSDAKFPVRRIYCVGRNYAAHIREMGGDERELPFFFQKPADAIVLTGGTVPYPSQTDDFQYEIELVLAIGKEGSNISVENASEHVFGLAAGIDLTRRDLQFKARNAGRPWESGKSFDHCAPISPIHPLNGDLPSAGDIALSVNGEIKQKGDLSELIWGNAEIVANLSSFFTLMPGDLIYTGTPSGVGPLQPGDRIDGYITGVDSIKITISR